MHHIVFKNVSLPSVVYTITILLRRRRRVSAHDDNSPFSFWTRTRTLKIIFKSEEILRQNERVGVTAAEITCKRTQSQSKKGHFTAFTIVVA